MLGNIQSSSWGGVGMERCTGAWGGAEKDWATPSKEVKLELFSQLSSTEGLSSWQGRSVSSYWEAWSWFCTESVFGCELFWLFWMQVWPPCQLDGCRSSTVGKLSTRSDRENPSSSSASQKFSKHASTSMKTSESVMSVNGALLWDGVQPDSSVKAWSEKSQEPTERGDNSGEKDRQMSSFGSSQQMKLESLWENRESSDGPPVGWLVLGWQSEWKSSVGWWHSVTFEGLEDERLSFCILSLWWFVLVRCFDRSLKSKWFLSFSLTARCPLLDFEASAVRRLHLSDSRRESLWHKSSDDLDLGDKTGSRFFSPSLK